MSQLDKDLSRVKAVRPKSKLVRAAVAAINRRRWIEHEDQIIDEVIPRVMEWMKSRPRKPAMFAFTAGLERQIAYLIEMECVDCHEFAEQQAKVLRAPPAEDDSHE